MRLKKCRREYMNNYYRTEKGLAIKIRGDQRRTSRRRGDEMPDYCNDELYQWMAGQKNFESLYNNWIASDYQTNLRPSCDRLDDYKPYTLDNLRLVTWGENKAKGHEDRKNGINNKISKEVAQLTLGGDLVDVFYSTQQASRATKLSQSNISICCYGKRNHVGGFRWMHTIASGIIVNRSDLQ